MVDIYIIFIYNILGFYVRLQIVIYEKCLIIECFFSIFGIILLIKIIYICDDIYYKGGNIMEINYNNNGSINNNIAAYINIIRSASETLSDSLENDVKKFTKDYVEISDRAYAKHKAAEDYDFDRLFKIVDIEIDKAKKSAKEHSEKQLKKKYEDEIQKRLDRQRVESKVALMEKTGVLWTGNERSPEAKQIIMRKAPGILSKYEQKQEIKEEQIERSRTE